MTGMRLSEPEARRRLASARVARLATAAADGRPHIVPVTFAVDGDRIYTAVDHKPKTTTKLRRLRNIAENPQVSLLADDYSDEWAKLWWARADGYAGVLVRAEEIMPPRRAAGLPLRPVPRRPAGRPGHRHHGGPLDRLVLSLSPRCQCWLPRMAASTPTPAMAPSPGRARSSPGDGAIAR